MSQQGQERQAGRKPLALHPPLLYNCLYTDHIHHSYSRSPAICNSGRTCVNDASRQYPCAVRILTGAQAGITFPISKAYTTIGRDPQNDIVLTDATISRAHARIVQHGSLWTIEKLAPNNTLKINQRDMQQ